MHRRFKPLIIIALIVMERCPLTSASIFFADGYFYGQAVTSRTIIQYDSQGHMVGSLTMPETVGLGLRGLAFGPDGTLYSVAADSSTGGFNVFNINSDGIVLRQYHQNCFISGNARLGKIAFDAAGDFYVGCQAGLVRFSTDGDGTGNLIYPVANYGITDVKYLANGNLLVGTQSEAHEITSQGAFVQSHGGFMPFTNLLALEYDPLTNNMFASNGSSPGKVLKYDFTTNVQTGSIVYNNPHDLLLTEDGRLIITSRNLVPMFYSQDFELLGSFDGPADREFMTLRVPEPFTAMLLLLSFIRRRLPHGRHRRESRMICK